MEAHRRLAAEVPGSDWYHEGGNLQWAAGDDEREKLRGKVAGTVYRCWGGWSSCPTSTSPSRTAARP